ncbi:hypothetical protein KPATCC21470_1798 [Kitasatospora purpeofusca]
MRIDGTDPGIVDERSARTGRPPAFFGSVTAGPPSGSGVGPPGPDRGLRTVARPTTIGGS